jgi:hypothetical protein
VTGQTGRQVHVLCGACVGLIDKALCGVVLLDGGWAAAADERVGSDLKHGRLTRATAQLIT